MAEGILGREDLKEAREFIDNLARTLTDQDAVEASEGLKKFGGRDADRVAAKRMGEAPGVGHQVIYALNHEGDAELPSWVEPINLAFLDPGKGKAVPRRIGISEAGIVLGDTQGFWITDFWTASKG